tara:strand:+ start:208 stop:399 length:192 start_codon:yes stop_codon:yes gene_type:complete
VAKLKPEEIRNIARERAQARMAKKPDDDKDDEMHAAAAPHAPAALAAPAHHGVTVSVTIPLGK